MKTRFNSKIAAIVLAFSIAPIPLFSPGDFDVPRDGDTYNERLSERLEAREEHMVDRNDNNRYVADELVVRYKGDDRHRFRVIRLPQGKEVSEARREYLERDDVESAEPNYIAHAFMMPNDPYYSYQWHFGNIGMESAWDTSTGSSVTIAIVDTGIAYEKYKQGSKRYYQAPDLADTIFVPGYDFANNDSHPNDDDGHGTHVAGTVAQSTNNGTGVAGIAFNASLMPVKVLGSNGTGTYADIANGVIWATDHGADIINMSLGGSANASYLEDAVQYAYENGVTIVAATGNDGISQVSYPAAYDNYVIAVGATRYDDTRAYYSNYGSSIDLVAPGGDLTIDQNGDGYGDGVLQQTFQGNPRSFSYYFFHGTSMASPHVAGVAALLVANGTATTPDDVRAALQETARDLGSSGYDTMYGHGIIDAPAALAWTSGSPPPPPPPPPEPDPPVVDLKANDSDGPITVDDGDTVTLSWTTQNEPTSCSATDAWSGSKDPAGGSESTGSLSGPATNTYTITCENDAGEDSDSVVVNVNEPAPPPPPPPEEDEVFADSFEISTWNGLWTEDSQDDWFRSSQRATDGNYSAEVDGRASDAALTSLPIDLGSYTNATITFSWFIEKSLDGGEYIAFETSTDNGSSWTEQARLRGNVDQEDVWHSESFNLTGITDLQLRFLGYMSRSNEDANVDEVKVVGW
jgi:serine protease